MAVYPDTPHHFEYAVRTEFFRCLPFLQKIFYKQNICFYTTWQERKSHSYEIEVVLIGFALQLNTKRHNLTDHICIIIYLTYFEWILMKYTVETKDILSHMVVNACTCRVTYGTPLR